MPSHSINLVKHNDIDFIAINDIFSEVNNNVLNFIEIDKPKCDPCITFDSRDIIEEPNGPLYIIAKIKWKLPHGVLIDPLCMVNVIMKYYLYTQKFHQYK